jgi:PAS domain S-box-containing protein
MLGGLPLDLIPEQVSIVRVKCASGFFIVRLWLTACGLSVTLHSSSLPHSQSNNGLRDRKMSEFETLFAGPRDAELADAQTVLTQLAGVSFQNGSRGLQKYPERGSAQDDHSPDLEARYRALVDQIPAVVFMAHLDGGMGEAYVSPQIEETLGFSQKEWLEDPIRWYQQIHPEDKQRWSREAAQMFLSGTALRSSYRIIARDGRVVWFHCEAKMIRRSDGRPWFIHGVAVDITELKLAEEAFEEERDVLSAILDTVGALVVVLDRSGRIVRFNRACEQTSGYSFEEVKGKYFWNLFLPEERERLSTIFEQLKTGRPVDEFESYWISGDGSRRFIGWSTTALPRAHDAGRYVIATGIDRTERKHLEKAILEASGREQRRIGQDLHDGLGQDLTGIAFMSKVQEQRLAEKLLPEAAGAAKIVDLVNEAINTTRQLARGLLPVLSDSQGLMSALQEWASEVEKLFHIECRFECDDPVVNLDETVATHLYRVAQEAVHNAIKHGGATRVVISLAAGRDEAVLKVLDDGTGIPDVLPNQSGMGLRIMNYRAGMIGGSLRVERAAGNGTLISCIFPTKRAHAM